MQSGKAKTKKWLLRFEDDKNGINPLMGWESSYNTLSELNLEFSTKEDAIKSVSYTHLTLPTTPYV